MTLCAVPDVYEELCSGLGHFDAVEELDLVEEYSSVKLHKRELREGSVLAVTGGRIVGRDSFRPDMSFEEQPQPAVPAPNEARATLARLAALHPIPAS
jgi:hypothetical protein